MPLTSGQASLDGAAEAVRAQALVAVPRKQFRAEAHVLELADRPRSEAVPTRLLSGKDLRSSSKTSWPALASQYAQDAPDGPAPITRTSQWCSPAGRPAVVLVICL